MKRGLDWGTTGLDLEGHREGVRGSGDGRRIWEE